MRLVKNIVEVFNRTRSGCYSRGMRVAYAVIATAAFSTVAIADYDTVVWTRNSTPSTVAITGGPWTLEQSGAANGLKSSGYCASSDGITGTEINNPVPSGCSLTIFRSSWVEVTVYRATSIGVQRTLMKLWWQHLPAMAERPGRFRTRCWS